MTMLKTILIILALGLVSLPFAKLEMAVNCSDNNNCSVTEHYSQTESVTEAESTTAKEDISTTVFTDTEEITSATKTTTELAVPTPTEPSFVEKSVKSVFCSCDLTINNCDINCCCDKDCSTIQKQVFTHCLGAKNEYDLKSCYKSDLFFNKPQTLSFHEDNGLFCLVRENAPMLKEFKSRGPIEKIEDFDRELKRQNYRPFIKRKAQLEFKNLVYKSGSVVWTIQRGALTPLSIPQPLVGKMCISSKILFYLHDEATSCSIPSIPATANCTKWLTDMSKIIIVSSPQLFNISDLNNSIKNCSLTKSCLKPTFYKCQTYPSIDDCSQIKNTALPKEKGCEVNGAIMTLVIRHNGTLGITSVKLYIWNEKNKVMDIFVKFLWTDASVITVPRSGNPGYITGRPILAAMKGLNNSFKPLPYNEPININCPNSIESHCYSRLPITFNEDMIATCSLPLQRGYFDKNGCLSLQNAIVEHLLGSNVLNITSNSINLYVGSYGNSRVDTPSDWIQVAIDSFSLISNQVSFLNSSEGLWCKRIVTKLYIDIAFSKFGAFSNPQSKIVGVLFRFGRSRDIFIRCYPGDCDKRISEKSLNLVTYATFIDLSTPPVHEFAQPPGIEAKLPHDFFYPFFIGKGHVLPLSNFLVNLSFMLIFIL